MMKKVNKLIASLISLTLISGCTSSNNGLDEEGRKEDVLAVVDVSTAAVNADLVVRKDMPDAVVEEVLSCILDDTSIFGSVSSFVSVSQASTIKGVPYHNGAKNDYLNHSTTVESAEAPVEGESADSIIIATGNSGGMYYALGLAMEEVIEAKTGISVEVVSTSGSQSNLEMIDNGEADFGFVQADVMHYAYKGERLYENRPLNSFVSVAALYPEAVQIVTLNPDIQTLSDLRGKKVSIGEAGSGVYYNALDVLTASGMSEEDIYPVYESFSTEVDSLYDGIIDAAFITAGYPTKAVTELSGMDQVYLVAIGEKEMAILQASSEYYESIVIPAGTYETDGE